MRAVGVGCLMSRWGGGARQVGCGARKRCKTRQLHSAPAPSPRLPFLQSDNDRDRGSLLYEERLERAERRRLAGNELFGEGRFKEALAKYALVGVG